MFKKITLRHIGILSVTILVVVMMAYLSVYASGIQDKLINFQGFLTDTSSNALDGTYAITFRIYENAGDQTPIWAEHHASVTVIKGNASILLGSVSALNLTFDQPRYIGIQVGNDPEMTPRQKIVPSFQAAAANKLVVTYANQSRGEYGVNNLIPIGGIISYYGDLATLQENWRICDGTTLNDPESPLNGQTLPNLLGQFIRGAESNVQVGQKGGADSINIQHGHTITIQDGGTHSHNGGSHTHPLSVGAPSFYGSQEQIYCQSFEDFKSFSDGVFAYACRTGDNASGFVVLKGYLHNHSGSISSSGDHTHPSAGNHSHGATIGTGGSDSVDNRPAFTSLYYIIRIK